MTKLCGVVFLGCVSAGPLAQTRTDSDFKLALPTHPGQLTWNADGYRIIESSANANGNEIGLRGQNVSRPLGFLGFLFLFSDQAPRTSAKCREGVMESEKKSNSSLKILASSEFTQPDGQPIAVVTYTSKGRGSKPAYRVRGFVAAGEICGDLEFYTDTPIAADDTDLKKVFASLQLDPQYVPEFRDSFLYAQILYQHRLYKAAAPIFEQSQPQLKDDNTSEARTMRRVLTDQAGMSYGMSGDIPKARAIFEGGVAKGPDHPLYYYNLACADAEEKKLEQARMHLQQAFSRRANLIPGEKIPDPTKDDSFLPYRGNRDFWKFLETLH